MSSRLTSAYLKKALEVHNECTTGAPHPDKWELAFEEYETDIPLYVAEIRTLRRKLSELSRKGGEPA